MADADDEVPHGAAAEGGDDAEGQGAEEVECPARHRENAGDGEHGRSGHLEVIRLAPVPSYVLMPTASSSVRRGDTR